MEPVHLLKDLQTDPGWICEALCGCEKPLIVTSQIENVTCKDCIHLVDRCIPKEKSGG
jgi:hypothetical protein